MSHDYQYGLGGLRSIYIQHPDEFYFYFLFIFFAPWFLKVLLNRVKQLEEEKVPLKEQVTALRNAVG